MSLELLLPLESDPLEPEPLEPELPLPEEPDEPDELEPDPPVWACNVPMSASVAIIAAIFFI